MYPDPERSRTRSYDASSVPAFYQSSPQRPQGGRRQACGYLVNPRREGRVAGRPRLLRPGRRQGFFWRLPDMSEWGLKGRRLPTLPLYGSKRVREWPEDSPVRAVRLRRPKRADGVATVQRRVPTYEANTST